jgi:hypothetical protein
MGSGTAHVLRVAAPGPQKPGEAQETEQVQVKTPIVVVRWRTADILGRSLCRGANVCEADQKERAAECWPEEIQAHLEPSHHERVTVRQDLAGREFPAKPARVTLPTSS